MTDDTKSLLWQTAQIDLDTDPRVRRRDADGVWIDANGYGDSDSLYGWGIEQIDPARGNTLDNFSALNLRNLDARRRGEPRAVVAVGRDNVETGAEVAVWWGDNVPREFLTS